MSGYRQEIVDANSMSEEKPIHHISNKTEDSLSAGDDSIIEAEVPSLNMSVEENWSYDGKQIQSFNSERGYSLEMADNNKINKRAVGVDIGTGFISCAEHEEGKKKFRKVRDAFFKLNPSKFLEGSADQFGESMLKNAGAHYVKVDGQLYVLGDDALSSQAYSIKSV